MDDLIERVERAENSLRLSMEDTALFLAAFGLTQRRYERGGWKFIYPDSGRPGSALRPFSKLDDLREVYQHAGKPLPEKLFSDPLKACAAALRALKARE